MPKYTDAFGHEYDILDREEAAATGVALSDEELAATRYPDAGRFQVTWTNENNRKVYAYEIEAGSMADAAWKVARYMFNCVSPDGRLLLDVVRLP
jgi:hypothetical protein